MKKRKVQIEKNVNTSNFRIELGGFIITIITLIAAIALHYLISTFSWYWVIFICVLVLVPVGLINFKTYIESKNNYTKEQKQSANKKIGFLIIWYWYLDCVYMVIFNHWNISTYIMASFAIIIILFNLVKTFLSAYNKNPFIQITLVFDFLIAIGLIVYLIYLMGDGSDKGSSLQNIILTITAAVLSGLLTLVGVAWTIKKTDESRKQDEIQRAIPMFSYNILRKEPEIDITIQKVCYTQTYDNDKQFTYEAYVELENSNKNSFKMTNIFHDDELYPIAGNTIVLPSSKCILTFDFSNSENIYLEILDELNKKHFYKLVVKSLDIKSSNDKTMYSIIEIVNVEDDIIKSLLTNHKI